MNKQQGIYPLKAICEMLGACRQTIMKYVKQYDIPCIRKYNKQVFITNENLKLLCQAMNYPYELLKGGERDD